MEVILLEKIGKLGKLGDVVRVKLGYARNYLIPRKKARRATPAAIQEFETRRAELEAVAAQKLAEAQGVGEKLNGLSLRLPVKAGVDGRLFGSIAPLDVAQALSEQGFEIHKSQVRMPQGPLKTVGDTTLQIALHADVVVEINVSVVPDVQ